MHFDDSDVLQKLLPLNDLQLDEFPFGIIRMDLTGKVLAYNSCESNTSDLPKEKTLGRNFFEHVAPCTNNYLVAQRFHDEAELDVILPYVFTFKIKRTPVRLRLLRASSSASMYLLVERST